jgi:hypothetical protein
MLAKRSASGFIYLKRAWSHRRQTCQRENKFSGVGVTGSMNGAAIQP